MTEKTKTASTEVQEAYLKLGMALRQAGDYSEALFVLRRVVRREPSSATARLALGMTLMDTRNYRGAARVLRQATHLAPSDDKETLGAAYSSLALAHFHLGRPKAFQKVIKPALQYGGGSAELWKVVGGIRASGDHHEDAIKAFDRAIELEPEDIDAYLDKAFSLEKLKRYEECGELLNKTIELFPGNAKAWNRRGKFMQRRGRHEEALRDLSQAIQLESDYVTALGLRGSIYLSMRRYEEALEDFSRTIDLWPDAPLPFSSRAVTYRQMGRYEEALSDFKRALELEPENARVLAFRGETYRQMGRYEEAIADFNHAITFEPENDWNWYNRAIIYAAQGKEDQALDGLQTAMRLARRKHAENPETLPNTMNLALYCVAAGEFTQAQEYYQEAMDAGVSPSIIQEGIRDLDAFLVLFPNHKQAQGMRKLLQLHIPPDSES
jgi:tetratricopeptide (TPR) repeat protein